MKKIILVIGIIVVAVLFAGGVLVILSYSQKPILEFSSECPSDGSLRAVPNDNFGITETKWTSNKTLQIKAYYQTACGGEQISGDYSIEGNNLTLQVSTKITGPTTDCVCRHNLVYTISNLPRKDYKVFLGDPKVELQKDETADWKTYQNEFYGYEIKYPLDWIIEISPDLSHHTVELWLPLEKFGISIYAYPTQNTEISGKTLEEYLETIDNGNTIEASVTVFNSKNITISGYPAIQREEIHHPEGVFKELTTYIKNDNFLITIHTIKDTANYRVGDSIEITDTERKTYNQILSTFKFTK